MYAMHYGTMIVMVERGLPISSMAIPSPTSTVCEHFKRSMRITAANAIYIA
jgi:hypothetical protein